MQDYSKYRIPTACGGGGCGSLRHNHKIGCGIPPSRPICGINASIKKVA